MPSKDIEKISNNEISVYENDIQYYIDMFCKEQNIDDIRSISQSVFNGLLTYVCHKYIKPSQILRIPNDTSYRYDIPQVEKLCDYYIYLCQVYDKECSIVGFSNLSGIDKTIIHEWEQNYFGRYDKASPDRSNIAKKLREYRETSLSDKLLTGKNPVGVLGILNHFYGWSMPGVRESATKSTGTLADLQKKAGLLSDNSTQKIAETASGSSLELSDNSVQ